MPLLNKTRPGFVQLRADWYQMRDGLRYLDKKTGLVHEVKAGFKWDLGSIIKLIPRIIVPHGDAMTYPSALHDKFYADFSVTKATADRILRQFLIEEGMARWRAWLAWTAVKLNFRASLSWGRNETLA